MAATGVIGAVGRHSANIFTGGDMIEQVRQHGTVAIAAAGKFHSADVGCGRIHDQMHLAPLAPALNTVLSGLPFAITEELDAGAVDKQVQWAISAPIRDLDGQRLLPSAQSGVIRHCPVESPS